MATRTYFTPDPEHWTARAERSGSQPAWRISDIKSATGRRRRTARVAKRGTVFTSDPQAMAPTGYTGSHLAH